MSNFDPIELKPSIDQQKFGTSDYVVDICPFAKCGENHSSGAFGGRHKMYDNSVAFIAHSWMT